MSVVKPAMAVVQRGSLPVEEDMSPFLTGLALPPMEEGVKGARREVIDSWVAASEAVLEWVLAQYDAEILRGSSPQSVASAAIVRIASWVDVSISELTTEGAVDGQLVQEVAKERERWVQLGIECAEASSRDLSMVDRYLENYLTMVRQVVGQGYGALLSQRFGS